MTAQEYKFTVTDTVIVIVEQDGTVHTIKKGAVNFTKLKAALEAGDWKGVTANLSPVGAIESWGGGGFRVRPGLDGNMHVTYGDEQLDSVLEKRILDLVRESKSAQPFLAFWTRLKKNPNENSVRQLYRFMQHAGIPIDTEGYLIAYKGVKHDYRDAYSGRYVNTPGSSHSMERRHVNTDPNVACHAGFHVGSLAYAQNFSQRCIVVRVDPADVCCVPNDSRSGKIRCCSYSVVGDWNGLPLTSDVIDLREALGGAPVAEPIAEPTLEEVKAFEVVEEKAQNEALERALNSDDTTQTEPPKIESEDDVIVRSGTKSHVTDENPVTKTRKPKPETGRQSSKFAGDLEDEFKRLDGLSGLELMKESFALLRKYATGWLKIVNGGRIPGGKIKTVEAITKTRGDSKE